MKKFFAIVAAAVLAIGMSMSAMAGPPADGDHTADQGNSAGNAHGQNPNKGKGNNSGKSDAAPGHNK